MSDNTYIRPDLKNFAPYSAHTSPDTLKEQFGLSLEEIIKLDANENPFGCLPEVNRALRDFGIHCLHPDSGQQELRNLLAKYTGVEAERIVVGAGSDQLIDLLMRLFVSPGDQIINLPPTFGMYPFYAKLAGARVVEVERDGNFGIDIDQIKSQITSLTRLIFVANPNNPSGNLTPRTVIKDLLDTGVNIVVDEAYYEFSRETVMPWVDSYDNLIILRSFSKWAGLAGLRIGYGIFPLEIADYLMRIKDPYSVNAAAQIAVKESLDRQEVLHVQIQTILNERQRLFDRLQSIDGIVVCPSSANFLLCVCTKCNAAMVVRELKNRGILVRYFDMPRLRQCIRISIGKPEQNDVLVESIREILGEDK